MRIDLALHEKRFKELTANSELKVKNKLLIYHYKKIIKSLKTELDEK